MQANITVNLNRNTQAKAVSEEYYEAATGTSSGDVTGEVKSHTTDDKSGADAMLREIAKEARPGKALIQSCWFSVLEIGLCVLLSV